MADLLNYRKEDSDMNYNINEQKLGFDRVLPWEGQVPALVKEGEHYFLQVKAPEAEKVTFTMNEEEFLFCASSNIFSGISIPVTFFAPCSIA